MRTAHRGWGILGVALLGWAAQQAAAQGHDPYAALANEAVLWVHHKDDPCRWTQHFRVRNYAEETKTPLVTVTGAGDVRGNPCDAFTQHGFVGMEIKTIKAILSWIRTGQVPPDVSE